MKLNVLLLFFFILISCSKNTVIPTSNNGPYSDSTNIAFRLSTIYWNDTSTKNTVEFNFKYDSISSDRWSSIDIKYEIDSMKYYFTYVPEFINGQLVKLIEKNSDKNSIEIFYETINTGQKFISTLRYKRENSPFSLKFEYDSTKLIKVIRYNLNSAGLEQEIEQSRDICIEVDYNMCNSFNTGIAYLKDPRRNSFYLCKEIAPLILILTKPYQNNINFIRAELPIIFSKYLPAAIDYPFLGNFELGLNASNEPNFIYYRPHRARYPEGYNFSFKK